MSLCSTIFFFFKSCFIFHKISLTNQQCLLLLTLILPGFLKELPFPLEMALTLTLKNRAETSLWKFFFVKSTAWKFLVNLTPFLSIARNFERFLILKVVNSTTKSSFQSYSTPTHYKNSACSGILLGVFFSPHGLTVMSVLHERLAIDKRQKITSRGLIIRRSSD